MTTGLCPARVTTTSSWFSVTELNTSAYRARDSGDLDARFAFAFIVRARGCSGLVAGSRS
jgi:hypothetical protein